MDWLTVWWIDWFPDWLTDWLTDWMFDWLINWLTVRISKGFLWWVWICKSVTRSLSIDRDQLFSSNPNLLHDNFFIFMKMTKFIVAKGFLSCAFTHASLWEIPGNEVVTLTLAAKASTLAVDLFRSSICASSILRFKYIDHSLSFQKSWRPDANSGSLRTFVYFSAFMCLL